MTNSNDDSVFTKPSKFSEHISYTIQYRPSRFIYTARARSYEDESYFLPPLKAHFEGLVNTRRPLVFNHADGLLLSTTGFTFL